MDFQNQAIFPSAELFLLKRFMKNEYGMSPTAWLLGTGLKESAIKDSKALVSLFQFDIIHRNIFRLVDDEAIGLKLGIALNLSRWGILSSALISSKSLGDALTAANQFRALLRSRFIVTTDIDATFLKVNLKSRPDMPFPVNTEFGHELFLGTLRSQIQDLLAQPFHFARVELNYQAPRYAKRYKEFLGCDIEFNRPESNIWIPLDIMSAPLPLANQSVAEQTRKICENEIERVDSILAGDVSWSIIQHLSKPNGSLRNLDEVAALLGLSSRTLRRNLKQNDTSFREIVQQFKQQLASQRLIEANTPIKQIAEQCGYNSAALFRTAFRRWYGVTPSEYQQKFRSS